MTQQPDIIPLVEVVDGVTREANSRSVEPLAEQENDLLAGLLSLRARQGRPGRSRRARVERRRQDTG